MSEKVTIYVALLDEGVDCWVPVESSQQDDGSFVICGDVPEGDEWQFAPGSRVLCEPRKFSQDEIVLVAVTIA